MSQGNIRFDKGYNNCIIIPFKHGVMLHSILYHVNEVVITV